LAKAATADADHHSPWILTSGAILVAFVVAWLSSIIRAFRHAPGLPGRDRVLEFFSPGSIVWAIAIVVAVILLSMGHHLEPVTAKRSDTAGLLPVGLFLAACIVGLSAFIDFLVELTTFGNGVNAAFAGFIQYAAVLPIAAATAWWALKETGRIHQ
jgi:hypothetical protein